MDRRKLRGSANSGAPTRRTAPEDGNARQRRVISLLLPPLARSCLRYNLANESFVLSKIRQGASRLERRRYRPRATPQLVSFPFRVLSPVGSDLFYFRLTRARPRRHRAENDEGLTREIRRSSRRDLKVPLQPLSVEFYFCLTAPDHYRSRRFDMRDRFRAS